MSKTWKWIIGIVVVLVVLAAVGLTAASFFGYGHMSYWGQSGFDRHPMMDDYNFGNRSPMDGFRGSRYPMMGGYGFMLLPFLFFGGLLRLAFPLAVLAAVGYFSYKKGKKDGMAVSSTPAPVFVDDEPVESPKP